MMPPMNQPAFRFFRSLVRPSGWLTAAGLVASAATVAGFLGRWSWFLDLFSHFRVQYALGLLVAGGLLLLGRRRRTAAGFLVLACVNLATVLPLYLASPGASGETTPALRAMLINVNTRFGDAEEVRAAILAADPDLLVLQEVNAQWMSALSSLTNAYPHRRVQPREDNFGIGFFSKMPLVEAEVLAIGGAGVPSILATVRTIHADLRVIATHPLPPGGGAYSEGRNEQLARLPDHVPEHLPVLLLGDLNVTPWNDHFRRLLARSGLRDSARGYGLQPTWPSHLPLLRIPIDHCLHSPDIRIVGRRVGESVSSDHYPLIVDFAFAADGIGRAQGRGIPPH